MAVAEKAPSSDCRSNIEAGDALCGNPDCSNCYAQSNRQPEVAPEILCAQALSEIESQLEMLEDAKRAFAAWMMRFLTFSPDVKRIETTTHVIRLAKMSVGCESCEQKKREATQFWHPGADSAFPYVAVEKKRGVQ